MAVTRAYALLMALPQIHLVAGQSVCQHQGKVAFGSQESRLFRHLDLSRHGDQVDSFIIAITPERPIEVAVTWHGIYLGHVQAAPEGTHPDKARYRPHTDYENDYPGHWQVFWEVRDLRPIAPISVGDLKRFDHQQRFDPQFMPERPLLIEHPYPRRSVSAEPLNPTFKA